jgi:UDP-N-acetylglucosamine/UDP-N-acetylgalactosamine diphosphorylase
MEFNKTYELLEKYGQTHLLKYYDELNDDQKRELLEQISELDFDLLKLLNHQQEEATKGVITPLDDAVSIKEIEENREKYTKIGKEAIREGKVAAILLAGGMGTRLGSDKPKGMYNIGETKDVYIFEMLINNLMDVVDATGAWVPLYIMTSEKNDLDTRQFFKDMNYFGYNPDFVDFFVQEMAPAATFD